MEVLHFVSVCEIYHLFETEHVSLIKKLVFSCVDLIPHVVFLLVVLCFALFTWYMVVQVYKEMLCIFVTYTVILAK